MSDLRGIQWRDSYLRPRIGPIDGRVAFMILASMMWFRWYTIGPTVLAIAYLWYVEVRWRMDIEASFRAIRAKIAGKKRPGHPNGNRRMSVDYETFGQID